MKKSDRDLRFESKFKISIMDLYILKDWIQTSIFFIKKHEDRRVNSLYFDTQDYLSAYENMSGQSERFKLRVRWYCKHLSEYNKKFLDNNTQFRVELKKKKNFLCDKILIDKFCLKSKPNNIERFNYLKKRVILSCAKSKFLKNFNFNPVIFVSYSREYFQLYDDKDIRITIDHDIRYSSIHHNNFHLASNDFFLVEIKFPLDKYAHVNELFSTFPFRKTRMSKYLIALSKLKSLYY